jgi:murein DD-endopeptidase MepM/ murein hydrolase activator NlpD
MTIDPVAQKAAITSSEMTAPNRAETIKHLAAQFESMLVSQMLREMQKESDESDSGGFGAALTDTMYGEMGNSIVSAGGLGLATSLEDAMARTTPGGNPATAGAGIPNPMPRVYSPWLPEGSTSFALDPERVSSAYGVRKDPIDGDTRMHKGIDIPLAQGVDIRSVKSGTVIESDTRNGYGNTIVIDHGNGVTTRYAHLSAREVSVGDRVTAGQSLGRAGQTGRATGPHLHLEVRKDGVAIDPLGSMATELLGRRIERNSVSADDVHGASR